MTYLFAIALICAYLIGSLPSAYIAGRLAKGIDIREVGTRNMGAMNTLNIKGTVQGRRLAPPLFAQRPEGQALAQKLGCLFSAYVKPVSGSAQR